MPWIHKGEGLTGLEGAVFRQINRTESSVLCFPQKPVGVGLGRRGERSVGLGRGAVAPGQCAQVVRWETGLAEAGGTKRGQGRGRRRSATAGGGWACR